MIRQSTTESVMHVFYGSEFLFRDQRRPGFAPGGRRDNFKAVIAAIVLRGSVDKREAGFAEMDLELLHLHVASSGLVRSLFVFSAQRQ